MDTIRLFGYVRTSTPRQSSERQIKNIESFCSYESRYKDCRLEIRREDGFTGTTMRRPVWEKLMKEVRRSREAGSNVTIIFDEVSRMSRTAEEGTETYFELYDMGVNLIFLKSRMIDTEVFAQKDVDVLPYTDDKAENYLFEGINKYFREIAKRQIRIAFDSAEDEVNYLRQRTKEGIREAREQARREGRDFLIGHPKGATYETKKMKSCKELIRKMSRAFDGTMTDRECYTTLRIAEGTYYKYKRSIRQDIYNAACEEADRL